MMNWSLSLFLMSLFILVGCNQEQPTTEENQGTGITIDPLSCQTGGDRCDMNWTIEKSRSKFPDNIEILVNDRRIFDECLREGNVGVTRRVDTVSMILWKFVRLDGTEDFKLQINDLKDCYSLKSEFYKSSVQKYEIKSINGDKQVFISL
jgi:hypothetical protein